MLFTYTNYWINEYKQIIYRTKIRGKEKWTVNKSQTIFLPIASANVDTYIFTRGRHSNQAAGGPSMTPAWCQFYFFDDDGMPTIIFGYILIFWFSKSPAHASNNEWRVKCMYFDALYEKVTSPIFYILFSYSRNANTHLILDQLIISVSVSLWNDD